MKIAHVCRLYESIPPRGYGSTERITGYLVDELVRQGQDVTLYATGDSRTLAKLRAAVPRPLRWEDRLVDFRAEHRALYERVALEAGEFELVHAHVDDGDFFRAAPHLRQRSLATFHFTMDRPAVMEQLLAYRDFPCASISDAQRRPAPWLNWIGTVLHGLPRDLYRLGEGDGGYLAFLGRIDPVKRVDRAIRIARACAQPLKIAAKIDSGGPGARAFEDVVLPMMDDPSVAYVGEVSDEEKQDFLGRASALLFPIDWEEPFGLVMIEAMACGTPVVAWRRGAAPEVIEHGVTGFLVDSVAEAAAMVKASMRLDRGRIRERFLARFTVDRMARDYIALYRSLIENR